MNHTTLGLVAVIAAAALVIGTFATTTIASPAFADSSKTITKQTNKQKLHQDRIINLAEQDATNVICINTRPCIVG
jgi:hypothetical protein